GNLPELAIALYGVVPSSPLPADQRLALALELDSRTTPRELRLLAHAEFWRLDPNEAIHRARKFLLDETPRANDTLPAELVEQVLTAAPGRDVDELLVRFARKGGADDYARRTAIQSLVARQARFAAADLAALYLESTRSFSLQSTALSAVLVLDLDRGIRLLDRMPDPAIEADRYELVRRLRREYGLPEGPAGGNAAAERPR
ncbi:MAG TPA: hypothetical protein VGC54_09060, partial [Planctomycetota bacterium]